MTAQSHMDATERPAPPVTAIDVITGEPFPPQKDGKDPMRFEKAMIRWFETTQMAIRQIEDNVMTIKDAIQSLPPIAIPTAEGVPPVLVYPSQKVQNINRGSSLSLIEQEVRNMKTAIGLDPNRSLPWVPPDAY